MLSFKKIAVIGAGIIGSSWAIVYARAGLSVCLYDQNPERRAELLNDIKRMLEASAALLRESDTVESVISRITLCDSLAQAVHGADLIQESVSEHVPLKREVFEQIESHCTEQAIIASSSSTHGVSKFASHLASRQRCLVLHPMTPPHIMPIIEVVAAPFTSAIVLERARALMRLVGQAPVDVHKEDDSFVLNRLQGALLLEIFKVIEEGLVTADDADTIIRQGLGLRWAVLGPLQGIDLNAPGGIRDYLARYGHIFNQMSLARGGSVVVNDRLGEQLDLAMRAQLPLDKLDDRRDWRDTGISRLRETLSTLPEESVHEND